jgi:hypothetical protein
MHIAGFIRYGITVLAGAIVPLIVLLALFLAGEPPAIIALWERGEVRVEAHETVQRDTGYGIVAFIENRAIGPDGETRLLRIAGDPLGQGAARLFPVGSTVAARLSPGGNIAWPEGETGLFSHVAWLAAPLVLLIVLKIVFGPLVSGFFQVFPQLDVREQAFHAALTKGIALISFITIPLFVLSLFWSFGGAPTWRWFAPIEQAQILEAAVEPIEGGQNWRALARVDAPGVAFPELRGVDGVFGDRAQAEQSIAGLQAGPSIRVRVYRHRPYAMKIYPFDFAVIAATLVCLLIMLSGLVAIARSILTGR